MAVPRRYLLIAAALLLAVFAVGQGAEWRWNQQAKAAARQRLLERLPQSVALSDDDLLHQVSHSGQGAEWLDSDPRGAQVWQADRYLGATPMELPPNSGELTLRTPWRRALAQDGQTHVALSAGPLTIGLRCAGLLGLVLLVLGWRQAPEQPQPTAAVTATDLGPLFGAFHQGQLCGSGSMGRVYRATHQSDPSRIYALKVLNPEWGQSEEFRQRFEREYQICRQLDSDFVVRVHDSGEKDGQLWMAMDFVEGLTLDRYLAQHAPAPSEILRLAVDLCQGLAYAHDLGIVHRDLKPDNILVTAQGRPIITDFGLARSQHYATITRAHTVLGTPAYMAPEQVEGSGIDQRADLYSLGCILYEALAGRPPFEGEAMEVVMAQLTREPQPISSLVELSPECQAVVHRLLAKDKSQRYSSAQEVKQALLALLT